MAVELDLAVARARDQAAAGIAALDLGVGRHDVHVADHVVDGDGAIAGASLE
jgi:hypothetical protein